MSGARDTTVNVLLGVLLVSVFLLPFFLYVLVAEYVLHALSLGVQHFFRGTVNPKIVVLAVFLLISLASSIQHVWKRRWRNAFLSFVILPMIASAWLADVHSPLGFQAPLWLVMLFPIFAISEESAPTRPHFVLAASAACAMIAINTGLLGSGILARVIADCTLTGLVIWFVFDVRQRWNSPNNPAPRTPLSPTHI